MNLMGVAQVEGVNGLILLPDNWVCPKDVTFKTGFYIHTCVDCYGLYQTLTASDWSVLELYGAIFLPIAGYRYGSEVAAIKNIGSELSSFHDREQTLPFVAQVGVSKGLNHLPLRLSVTLTDLTRWSSDYYILENAEDKELSFSKKLLNHVIIGADYFINDNISLSAGYNFRRAYDLKTAGSAHGAGLTAGATLQIKQFMISGAYAKYHKSTSSLMFNVSYTL
jgi:hypothetical protein